MKKIISLFQRDHTVPSFVRNEVTPGAEWVIAGEGIATRKYDGSACLLRDGELLKRFDAKNGKTPPPGFEPAQEASDPITGHWPGWVPIGDGPDDRWHREALARAGEHGFEIPMPNGTYELCGPKVQGNPEKFDRHWLIPHGATVLYSVPRTFDALIEYLVISHIEGIVWHHADGRMVKIKAKDFGITRHA